MIAAGLLAKKAVERGLRVDPAVKTSLAPGSRVVSDYLDKTGLQKYLDELGFNLVGYGCTTCIGNSGPLHPEIEKAIHEHDLVAASVLSGNRNFEARVHQNIKANFLMSPPLVVAFALAGRVDIDLSREPLGKDRTGRKPSCATSGQVSVKSGIRCNPRSRRKLSENFIAISPIKIPKWNEIPSSTGDIYQWDEKSDYIHEPPFFQNFSMEAWTDRGDSRRARTWDFRRFGHDRSHFSGRRDQGDVAGGRVFEVARNSTGGFQQLWLAARQRSGDDARHIRERADQEPDGARN